MEDRRDRQAGRVALVALALLLMAAPAAGQEGGASDPFEPWSPTVDVSSGSNAVVVESEVGGSVGGGAGARASGGGSSCRLEPISNIGAGTRDAWGARPGEAPFFLYCDGELIGVVWRPIDGGGGPAAPVPSPREIALRLRERIPIPEVTIGINPDRGLVGVESWFWLEGYDGSPIRESTDAFGRRVEVEARVKRYDWRFGDGGSLSSRKPGTPYPERSDVRHTYERSSRGHAAGYRVEMGFVFSVRYRVGGGGWIDLPGIERVAEARYPVRESQAVIER